MATVGGGGWSGQDKHPTLKNKMKSEPHNVNVRHHISIFECNFCAVVCTDFE